MSVFESLAPAEEVTETIVADLGGEEYRAIAGNLAITDAEQKIIEEVATLDEDEQEEIEREREEAEDEKSLKGLFESLYEIDPETNEPFVKGSAYDLKKWDEDMLCLAFSSPERVVALEAYEMPGERLLNQIHERLETKRTKLANVVAKHALHLKAQTISKGFARDFKGVMGYEIPNFRMESFTEDYSPCNYALAMEEVNGQQAALMAGAAVAGFAIVYKLIQWFSRSLNKNSESLGGIGRNLQAYEDRKRKFANTNVDLAKDTAAVNEAVKELKAELKEGELNGVKKALGTLNAKINAGKVEEAFDAANKAIMIDILSQKYTPFMDSLLAGMLDKEWWSGLGLIINEGATAMNLLSESIKEVSTLHEVSENKPEPIAFNFLNKLNRLRIPALTDSGWNNVTPFDKMGDNWEKGMLSFNSARNNFFTPIDKINGIDPSKFDLQRIAEIDLTVFDKLSSDAMQNLIKSADALKEESRKAYKDMDDKNAKKDARIEAKRDRVNLLTREFKAIANVVRFSVQVRNQVGILSIALEQSSKKSDGFFKRLMK